MLKEFKEFALRGNVIDMAIGIVIGVAFGSIVNSMVADIITPPLGLLLGNVDFSNMFIVLKSGDPVAPYVSTEAAKAAGAITLNIGLFFNKVISFLLIAFPIFLLVRAMNQLKRKEEAKVEVAPITTKECPFCAMTVSLKAKRCPHCTSELA